MVTFFNQKNTLRSVAAALLASLLVACGGGGSNPVAPVVKVTAVSGTIRDAAGTPLAGASVTVGASSATTGSDGSYKLDVAAAQSSVVLVKKTGFTTTAKEVPAVKDRTTQVDVKMFADQVSTTFSATAAASIAVKGATVQIPANALKFADGGDFTGTVGIAASYYSPDNLDGVQAFAGPYTGTDGGTQSPIISMGFMEVKLTDNATGRPLQLKAGAPATLIYPASSNSADAATVPMWFYDETAKIWVREGQATRQADGSYLSTVAHFTLWNVDFWGLTATIKGCFRDAAGQPVTEVGINGLRGTGWNHLIPGNNADGNFEIILVPANMSLELFSAVSPASFASVAIPALTPGEIRQLPCIQAIASSSNVIVAPTTPFGATTTVPVSTSTAVYAGRYSGTYSGVEQGTFSVVVSANGNVSGTNYSQTYNQTFLVQGQVSANGTLSLTATAGTAGSAQFTGAINPAGAVSGNWNYVGATLGGTFTGQRS